MIFTIFFLKLEINIFVVIFKGEIIALSIFTLTFCICHLHLSSYHIHFKRKVASTHYFVFPLVFKVVCPIWQPKKRLSLLGALLPLNTFASSVIYPVKIAASRMHCGLRLALFISKFSLLPPAYKSETYLLLLIVWLLYVYSQVYFENSVGNYHESAKK